MQKTEINKLVVWLQAIYPSFKPDQFMTRVWAETLPDVPFETAQQAVEVIGSESNSDFAPSVLRIKNKLTGAGASLKQQARLSFGQISAGKKTAMTPVEREALTLIGGSWAIRHSTTLDFLERRYVDIYQALSCVDHSVKLLRQGNENGNGTRV